MATVPLLSRAASPRVRLVNGYIDGSGPSSYEAAQEARFSYGFGQHEANRGLMEWMRT
jgi:erythromycin esterase-like protein